MSALERVAEGIQDLDARLDSPGLDPNPARDDWEAHQAEASQLLTDLKSEVLAPLDEALAGLEEPVEQPVLKRRVAHLAAEVALLLEAARHPEGRSLLHKACGLVSDPELDAAVSDPGTYALLVRGRWLHRNGYVRAARKIMRQVIRLSREPTLAQAARQALAAPRPIHKAPPLYQLNGCGAALYGSRDQQPDGSYVATLCISLVWIPVFPLAAYRVVDHGENSYGFLAREQLGKFARGFRWAVAAGVVLMVAVFAVTSYLESPDRLARIALQTAEAQQAAGKTREAAQEYERLIHAYGYRAEADLVDRAARSLVQLYLNEVAEPFDPADLEKARGIVHRYRQLPLDRSSRPASGLLADKLASWARSLGTTGDPGRLRAGVRLMDLAVEVHTGTASEKLAAERTNLRLKLAGALADDWPVLSLESFLACEDHTTSIEKTRGVMEKLAVRPWLLLTAGSQVEQWMKRASGHAGLASLAKRVSGAYQKASEAARRPQRVRALDSSDATRLGRYLKKFPDDQEIAVALAGLLRQRGRLQEAIETLRRLGEPGWMIPGAQFALAGLYSDAAMLDEAEHILEPYLAGKVEQFQLARQRYVDGLNHARERIVRDLEAGMTPIDLERKLQGASEADQQRIFEKWLTAKLTTDENLARLKADYEARVDVVPAALTMGMVKLRRANKTGGEERTTLLAQAERAFLAIRHEAEGLPDYHLGLGQVYHRLGRHEEGEREFAGVLAHKNPQLTLGVAQAYRQLGLIARAREVTQPLLDRETPFRDAAAVMLSVMAQSVEETERWLRRANPENPQVRRRLDELEAYRLMGKGRFRQADQKLARLAATYEKEAAHNPAAANNAALNNQLRYQCTGDPGFIHKAAGLLEAARRLEPDNTVVLQNLAEVYDHVGYVDVLEKWVRISRLRPTKDDAMQLLDSLATGPLRDQVLKSVRQNPHLQRTLQLSRQEEVLAPEKPAAYLRQLERFAFLRDAGQIQGLLERLQRIRSFDTTVDDEMRDRFQSGEKDARVFEQLETIIKRMDDMLATAKSGGHQPTVAAAQIMRGTRLMTRSVLGNSAADALAAADAYESAERAWPDCGGGYARVWALVWAAILRSAEHSKTVAAVNSECHRTCDFNQHFERFLGHEHKEEILGALRRQAELQQAARLFGRHLKDSPRLSDWQLARLMGDEDLERRTAAVFNRPEARMGARIRARLSPTSDSAREVLELFEAHPPKDGG